MIVLEALSCTRAPPLTGLTMALNDGELALITGPERAERLALVELLAGLRAESDGLVLHDGKRLTSDLRQKSVVVLPRSAALSPGLSAAEHVRLVASLRNLRNVSALLEQTLRFAGLGKGGLLPDAMSRDEELRFTLALAVLGSPALVVALDPPPEVSAVLVELHEPTRTMLVVDEAPDPRMVEHATSIFVLGQGRLAAGAARVLYVEGERRLHLRLAGAASPDAVLQHHGGVTCESLGQGSFRLRLMPEASPSRVIRALQHAGLRVEELREEPA